MTLSLGLLPCHSSLVSHTPLMQKALDVRVFRDSRLAHIHACKTGQGQRMAMLSFSIMALIPSPLSATMTLI